MSINPMDFLKNFQNMGSKIAEMQEKMKNIEVVGTSGGGLVQIEINGQLSVTKVSIEKDAVDPVDISMLEDLVLAALTDALFKVKEKMKEEATSATGDLNLPPGMLGL